MSKLPYDMAGWGNTVPGLWGPWEALFLGLELLMTL